MPAMINVYCRNAEVRLDAKVLLREIEQADLTTLVEVLDLPEGEEAAVEAIWPHLRVERAGDTVEVHWKPDGRPIQLDVVQGGEVTAYLAELLADELPPTNDEGAARVRAHLYQTRSIVFMEMGLSDSDHLGATIGEVLAFFVAERGDGLVWFFGCDWVSPEDRGASIWTTK